eukprot:m.27614 g.27614  ORF g.27614 m.27614 type:complete len:365 (+) comp10284_c0_seq1:44-1138(+)
MQTPDLTITSLYTQRGGERPSMLFTGNLFHYRLVARCAEDSNVILFHSSNVEGELVSSPWWPQRRRSRSSGLQAVFTVLDGDDNQIPAFFNGMFLNEFELVLVPHHFPTRFIRQLQSRSARQNNVAEKLASLQQGRIVLPHHAMETIAALVANNPHGVDVPARQQRPPARRQRRQHNRRHQRPSQRQRQRQHQVQLMAARQAVDEHLAVEQYQAAPEDLTMSAFAGHLTVPENAIEGSLDFAQLFADLFPEQAPEHLVSQDLAAVENILNRLEQTRGRLEEGDTQRLHTIVRRFNNLVSLQPAQYAALSTQSTPQSSQQELLDQTQPAVRLSEGTPSLIDLVELGLLDDDDEDDYDLLRSLNQH